jgi:hypothetical protein
MIQLLLVAAGTAMTFTQFAGAGVGISAISIATVNGLQGSSSGGNSPVITLSTTLAAGPVKSNGAGAFISQTIALGGAEVSGTLAVGNGGTGAVSFTSGGLLRGNNVGALSVASAADIVAAIGATFVTNATNATATNTVNVGVTNDAATATPVFLSWVSAASEISLPKFQVLISFVPSTGILSATGSQEMVLH